MQVHVPHPLASDITAKEAKSTVASDVIYDEQQQLSYPGEKCRDSMHACSFDRCMAV